MCIKPELVVDTKFSPGEILIFKDEMLIGARAGGEVYRVSIVLSGMPVLVGTTATGAITAMSATASAIFVVGSNGTARMDWTGMSQYSYGTVSARAIDTDGTLVYWTASNAVRNGPVAGGTSNTFFSHAGLLTVLGLALNGTDAYWGLSDGTIWTSAKAPVMAGKIGTGPTNADNLVVDGTTIYWSSSKGIHSISTKGGATTDLAPASSTVRALAVDATHVYWTDESAGLIQRVLKDGSGKPEILAIEQAKPWGLALTAQTIYWANGASSQIMKLPK